MSRVPMDVPLSPAEQRVFALALAGASRKQIREELGISRSTVDYHFRMLDCKVPGRKPIRMRIQLWGAGIPIEYL